VKSLSLNNIQVIAVALEAIDTHLVLESKENKSHVKKYLEEGNTLETLENL
jgi:hypothetical protein